MKTTGIIGAMMGLFIGLILISNIPMGIITQIVCVTAIMLITYFLGILSEYIAEYVYI